MNDHPIQGMLGTSMEKLREMIDVNTIIGEAIKVEDGVTIIPISKVTYGFGSGGSNFPSSSPKDMFGGGVGAGATVQPLAFLVIKGEDVEMIQINNNSSTSADARETVVIPDLFDKIRSLISKKQEEEETQKS